jgi:hypothetical protein
MEWRDEGVILSVRRHGETSAIAEILTAAHGRVLGLVRGGRSRVQRPVLQAGNAVQTVWRARLEEQLGTFTLEPLDLRAGAIMEEPFRLAGLATLTGLAQLLPEREPHPRVYEALRVVLEAIGDDQLWPALLVRWELGLSMSWASASTCPNAPPREPAKTSPMSPPGAARRFRRKQESPSRTGCSGFPPSCGRGERRRRGRDRGAEACRFLPRAARVRAARDAPSRAAGLDHQRLGRKAALTGQCGPPP